MISSIDNHAVIFSYDFMKLMDKSKVQNSEDMPIEVKMAMRFTLEICLILVIWESV